MMIAYSCSEKEKQLFTQAAKKMGIVLITTEKDLTEDTVGLAKGAECISINHSVRVSNIAMDKLHSLGVRYISTRTVGYDHIDIEHADCIGMCVGNVSYSPGSVAEYAVMLMLMTLRKTKMSLKRMESGDYCMPESAGKELRDLTVGVMGTGAIGATVISILYGFGCRILAYDLERNHRVMGQAEYVSKETILAESDIITLHMPGTAATYHIIDEKSISKLKTGAIIINTGRGQLINTDDLIDGLESGRVGGAALDVIENEAGVFYNDCHDKPPANRKIALLSTFPNVILTPHLAFYTAEAIAEMVGRSVENCAVFERKSGHVWINKEESYEAI